MAKREKKEKIQSDLLLDQIGFKGLTQKDIPGKDCFVKMLSA